MVSKTTAKIIKACRERAIERDMFEQIPLPQPKWLKRAIVDEQEEIENEELYEQGMLDYIDHYAEWSKDELRLFHNMKDINSDYDYEKWPSFRVTGPVYVVKVEPMFISDFEPTNPYYAGRYPSRYNPNRDYYTQDVNLVQRRFVDGVTKYMGNPTYSEEPDRLIWVDIECVDMHGHYGTIRVKPDVYKELDIWGIYSDEYGLYHMLTLYKGYPVFTHQVPDTIPVIIKDDCRPMFDENGMYQSPVTTEILYEKHSGTVFKTKLHYDDHLGDKRPIRQHQKVINKKQAKIQKIIDNLEHSKQVLIKQHFTKGMHSKEYFIKRGNEIQARIDKLQSMLNKIG